MLSASDAVNQVYQQLNLIGQQIDQSDVFMYLTNAVNYFATAYSFPNAKQFYNTLVFNGVREYSVPSDFGTLVEPQRFPALWSPRFMNKTGRELTHWPYGRTMSLQYDRARPFLLIADNVDSSALLLSGCDGTTGVTISGDGSELSVDNMIYTEGTGSLRFRITASTGQTILTFTGLGPIDISSMLTKNWGFYDLISPETNTLAFASVKLRLGNDSSNYYEMSATARFNGVAIETGYGQIGFDFTSRTMTGTVTDNNVVWMQVVLNNGLTGVDGIYHLDNIFTAQGIYFQIPYYSKNNILAGGVTPTDVVTSLTDEILLPVECNEAILYKTLELICASPNVANQNFANYAARELKPKEMLLMSLYPVERSLVQSQWYKGTNFKQASYYRYY